jgi:aminoglycoside phosphotransferase
VTKVIDARARFEQRRMVATLERAARILDEADTKAQPFHQEFQRMLWGRGRVARKEYQEAQRRLNDLTWERVAHIIFPNNPLRED